MTQFEFLGMNFTCAMDSFKQFEIPPNDCLLPLISKILGYCIVVGASIVKLPQIIIILKNRSVEGLNKTSFELEVVGFTIALAYCLYKQLHFSAYGELVFLLLQGIILLTLIYYYSTNLGPSTWLKSAIYCAVAPSLLAGNVSGTVIETLYACQHAIFLLSRIPQIYENYSTKSTGQLSIITNLMVLGGCVVRVFTSIQQQAPSSMIMGSVFGLITNGTILSQIILYSGSQRKEKKA